MDEQLERTLPYGSWRMDAQLAMRIGRDDSFGHLFNPSFNPGVAPAVRRTGRRRAVSTTLTLSSGPPIPPGTDMPRTPERAPRHAPDVRIGCDIHPVAETANSIAQFGDRYLHRVFTDHELDQCGGDVERLTGRFAAKEAVLKVLQPTPTDAVPLRTIEVRSTTAGVPYVALLGAAAELAERQGIDHIDISLSHDGGLGMAVAAALHIPKAAA
jgi:holo-[acyl-carrier protein] synthase